MLLGAALVISSVNINAGTVSAAKKKKLSLNKTKVTLKVGKKVTLKVKNKPSKAKVTFATSNKKVAKVNKKGKVTAVKKGSAKITAKVKYKNNKKTITKKLVCKVKVVANKTNASSSPAATSEVTTTTSPVVPSASPLVVPTIDPSADVSASPSISRRPKESLDPVLTETNLTDEHKSASGLTTKDNGLMRKDVSTLELSKIMGLGWNLGNQLETYQDPNTVDIATLTVEKCETSAGNPVATQATFDGLKKSGINTVRIPMGWSNLMSTDGTYTINKDLLDRCEEVTNYALNNEMYVIINVHWDGGWWGMFGSPDENVRKEGWKKYESIWNQLSERFKDYSDHVIFEAANEELSNAFPGSGNLGLNTAVGETGFYSADAGALEGTLTTDEIYETAYEISQKFVDIVRNSGGNNKYRHLVIPGNDTSIDKALDSRFKMPTDIEENGNTKLSVDIHYYDPSTFGISRTATTSWGFRDSWGTDEDYTYMNDRLARLEAFTNQGYGIILGECGVAVTNKDGIPDYLLELFTQCLDRGYTPCMWDEGLYFNRKDGYFTYSDVGEVFGALNDQDPYKPADGEYNTTGVPDPGWAENQNPKVLYTWEGEFMRHTGDGPERDAVIAERGDEFNTKYNGIRVTKSIYDAEGNTTTGMRVRFDPQAWHMHVYSKWAEIEKPVIRIYPMDNQISQTAQLQLAYCESGEGGTWVYEKDYDVIDAQGNILESTNWVGKYIELNPEYLEKYPWVWITTNTYTGASYVKVEICDGAYNADGTKFESAE